MTNSEYLVSKGWRKIGTKRHQHGPIECWVPPSDSKAEEDPRSWWTQGDALSWQKMKDQEGVLPELSDRYSV